jgi:hypothetical protein
LAVLAVTGLALAVVLGTMFVERVAASRPTPSFHPRRGVALGGIVADGNLGAQAWVVSTLAALLPLGARHGGE